MNMAYGQLHVHCVWSTKDRNKRILIEQEPMLYGEMLRKCDALKCQLVAANGMSDHAHVLVRVWPSVSVAKLVQELKGATSRMMNVRFEQPTPFRWQEGYGAFSISQRNVPLVAEYVKHQKLRHAEGVVLDALERCWFG
jgi:putative transposase